MRGYFTSPTVLVVDSEEVAVRLSCVLPAFYLKTMVYWFEVSVGDKKITYLKRFIGWCAAAADSPSRRPRPFCTDVATVLFAGQVQHARIIRRPNVKLADLPPITSTAPAAVVWRDFKQLELLRLLTGEWRVWERDVVRLVQANAWRTLVIDNQVRAEQ